MSIASEIQNYADGLSDAYNAVNDMSGVIPQDKNMNNLDTAIRTIPVGSAPNDGVLTIQQNGSTLGTFSANQSTNTTVNITAADCTILYISSDPNTWSYNTSTTFTFYSDRAMTTAVDGEFVATALNAGAVCVAFPSSGGGTTTYFPVINSYVPSDPTDPDIFDEEGLQLTITDSIGEITWNIWTFTNSTTTNGFSGLPYRMQKRLTAGSNITISDTTISATDTTYSDFTGATSSVAGAHGLVPAPAAGDQGKVLHGDGTWKDTTAKLVEMSYGESNAWAKFIAAYNAGSIVYCRASSNANPGTGSQTRKAFMAYVNNATNPTSVEFQYVRSQSSKTDSQQCDQVFVYTLTNASGGTWSVASRNMAPKINVDGPITKTFTSGANATLTIGASAMTGATSSAAGAAGVVPAPAAGDNTEFLRGDGTWATPDAPVITMTDTDPGEGGTLAANNFIFVYEA